MTDRFEGLDTTGGKLIGTTLSCLWPKRPRVAIPPTIISNLTVLTLTYTQIGLVADFVRLPNESVVSGLLPVGAIVGNVPVIAALAVWIAALGEIAEEVEHRFRHTHVLSCKVLWEKRGARDERQTENIGQVFASYAT